MEVVHIELGGGCISRRMHFLDNGVTHPSIPLHAPVTAPYPCTHLYTTPCTPPHPSTLPAHFPPAHTPCAHQFFPEGSSPPQLIHLSKAGASALGSAMAYQYMAAASAWKLQEAGAQLQAATWVSAEASAASAAAEGKAANSAAAAAAREVGRDQGPGQPAGVPGQALSGAAGQLQPAKEAWSLGRQVAGRWLLLAPQKQQTLSEGAAAVPS